MKQNKIDFNTKQKIITRLLENLQKADDTGKREIVAMLVEHTDITFLTMIDVAIDMTPETKASKSKKKPA